ncbi:unnamed protein product, partial [marine sediment metagenome]
DRHAWDTLTDGFRIKRLTPIECERLQGFPDGWTEGISDTQRYKCLEVLGLHPLEGIRRVVRTNHL